LRKHNRRRASFFVDPDFARALKDDVSQEDSAGKRAEHKSRQLCRQAQRAVNLALSERGSDPGLEQLYVDEVTFACGHLLVHVVAPAGRSLPEVLEKLRQEAPRLRLHVARAISRKRAPELSFAPSMRAGGRDE
jgi:ribosome-binding factor A